MTQRARYELIAICLVIAFGCGVPLGAFFGLGWAVAAGFISVAAYLAVVRVALWASGDELTIFGNRKAAVPEGSSCGTMKE